MPISKRMTQERLSAYQASDRKPHFPSLSKAFATRKAAREWLAQNTAPVLVFAVFETDVSGAPADVGAYRGSEWLGITSQPTSTESCPPQTINNVRTRPHQLPQ